MASFKKFLAYTAVTAAAVAGGVALYKKVQENKANSDEDFDDFDDDDFDDDFEDDFEDLDIENRSYTAITSEEPVAASETTEEDSEETDSEDTDSTSTK